MIGSFIAQALLLVFGYAFPAYECYKSVEMNKPDIHQLRFWCQYWILMAGLTICERISDVFIGWIPMYGEAKLVFVIYLWFPQTKGTTYVYQSFFRPYLAKHETEIDHSLLELRTRAGDMAVLYSQKAASYLQTRVFDIFLYIASQSSPKSKRPDQTKTQVTKAEKFPAASTVKPPSTGKEKEEQSPSPSATTSSEKKEETKEKAESSETQKATQTLAIVPSSVPSTDVNTAQQAPAQSSKTLDPEEEQVKKIDCASASSKGSTEMTLLDAILAESGRITRARTRRLRGASTK